MKREILAGGKMPALPMAGCEPERMVAGIFSVPEAEIGFRYVRASGPGGQNVNKVSTAVELRFDIDASPTLPADVKSRLRKLAGKRVSGEGVLLIDARRFRTQEANRRDAVARLEALIEAASVRPKSRVATRPTRASRERRVATKKRRATLKRGRGRIGETE